MARQGYDLQLPDTTKRWLARDLLHHRDGTLTDERDRHRVGAHGVARDAAGGVRGAETGRKITRMRIRWNALVAVAGDARPLWIFLAGVILACVVGWLCSSDMSAAVRYAGTVLQMLGLLAVAHGLRETRKLFGAPTMMRRVWGWFGRLRRVFRRPEPIILQASAAGFSLATGRARLRRGVGAGATVEQRVEVLEANLQSHEQEFDQTTNDLSSKSGQLEKNLSRERDERKAADDKTWRQIEEVAIGGLHLELVGLWWLALAVLGTSIPDELASLLCRVVR